MGFIKLVLKRPVTVLIFMFALIIFGIMSIFTAPVERIPDIENPMLIVTTVYPGAGSEDVDELVSQKIEDNVSTLSGLKNLSSTSQENLSMVMLELDYGTDLDVAHSDLQKKIDVCMDELPDSVSDPIIMEVGIDEMADITITLSAWATGDINLYNFVDDNIVPRFEQVSGVASVDVAGGEEEYISIQLMDDKLKQYGLNMSTVASCITSADYSLPVGDADFGTRNLEMRSGVSYDSVESLGNIPIILKNGDVIRLSDVAHVFKNTKDSGSISRYNGEDIVSLSIKKRSSASTVDVCQEVVKRMEELNAQDSGVMMSVVNDGSEDIMDSMKNVVTTLILAVILCMAVLFLFFGSIRASLIVGSSIPVSLLATVILMNQMGISFNMVSLSGLVISVGMMVDNSIVVLESCFRKRNDENLSFADAALYGTKIVLSSVIASTITTVVVFLPISVMKGMSGQMFKELGFTVIFALTASLVSAVSLVPFCFMHYQPREKINIPVSRLVMKMEKGYSKLMQKILPHRVTTVLFAVILLAGSFVLYTQLEFELMPPMDEGTVSMEVETRPGLKTEELDKTLRRLEELAVSNPDVERYLLSTGGQSLGTDSSISATLTAYLKDDRIHSTKETVAQWQQATTDMEGCAVSVSSSSSTDMMTGGSGIEVAIQGNDFSLLRDTADQIAEMMRNVPGVLKTTSSASGGGTQGELLIDPIKAAAVGFTPAQISSSVYSAMSGIETVTLSMDGQDYTLWVEYPQGCYQTVNDVKGITLTSPTGKSVPLMDVASLVYSDSPQTLTRKNGAYQVTINAYPTDATKSAAQKAINSQINTMERPEGVELVQSSMSEMMVEEFTSLLTAILTAVLLVFMVMSIQFESMKFSGIVMLCIPFSLIGSFGLLYLTTGTLDMTALIGFLMLVGTVVNNGILFVDTTNLYRASMDVSTALIMAGRTRLRPILMTALTTILSMIPTALAIGSGSEMMQGMAITIIGGLTASTLLTLFLLPSFYLLIDKKIVHQKRRQMISSH